MRVWSWTILCCLVAARAQASPPELGRWLTQDRSSVITITSCGTGLCGRIVGISLDHPADPPPKDVWGQPQCGETIIRMAGRQGDGRWHGTILDPRSGRDWSAQVWRVGRVLHLRGFIGLPLFGATQVWTPYDGVTTPVTCTFTSPATSG